MAMAPHSSTTLSTGLPARMWRRAWPRLRRALYWTHRWMGIAGCLLFAAWFASGLVMMYVAFPSLTSEERLAGLQPLRLDEVRIGAEAALSMAGQNKALGPSPARGGRVQPPRAMSLEMLAAGPQAGPVWRIVDVAGERHTVSARDGRALAPVDAAQAQAIARAFSRQPGARWAETLQHDQWTVPNALDPLRPLHRIEVGDAAGTELYVSAVTGEVVRDTTRHERFWNWLGAVPHWIYFTPLRADPPLWRDVVLWVSGACIVSAITGIVIGILRVRVRQRYRQGRITPYRGWGAWHHVAGLVGGVFVLSWIASGWLSMDPNRWFQRPQADARALERYHHGDGTTLGIRWPVIDAALPVRADARELRLMWFSGRPLLQWRDGLDIATTVDAGTGRLADIAPAEVAEAVRRLKPAASVQRFERLTREDAYWYSHHHRRTLPVWRIVVADAAGTWLHIDPASGQILGQTDDTGRARRWLFNAAHSLDFPWLIRHRPAWDALVWFLSAAGLLVSVSGVVVGWRRLRQAVRRGPGRAPSSTAR